MLSALLLAGLAGNAALAGPRHSAPPPPDSPLALLPVDPRETSHGAGRDRAGSTQRNGGNPTAWIRQHGTPGYDQATGIVAAHDHVFTVGYTGEGLDGNASAGNQDMFLMKHSLAGAHQWTRQLGSASNDYATGVALSNPAQPLVYVTGYTFGRMPGVPNSNTGGADLFLTKYDNGGTPVWTRQLGSSGGDYAQAVATDAAGNVYVAGYTTGHLDANTSAGLKDAFLVKYDANGDKKWTQQLGTSRNDEARAVTVDANGAIYVAGLTYGALPGATSLGDADMFLARYDTSGNRLWVRQAGTADVDVAQGVTTTRTAAGAVDVYVSGYSLGAFGGPRAGGYDAVVAKFSDQGTAGWKVQRGSAGNDLAYGLTSDGSGKLYFTGTTNYDLGTNLSAGSNDVFLTELKASDGAHLRSRQLGSTHPSNALAEGDIAFGVTLDRDSGIYVAGYTEGEFEDTLLAGDKDILIAKYGEGCNFLAQGSCGCGYGWGDPHDVTFDHVAYDFQAAGEFILAESLGGSPFVIQVRQQSWGVPAVFTAVAARVGTDRVGLYAGRSDVFINGVPTPITGVTPLPGGGSLSRQPDGAYLVAWPGSERMKVYDNGSHQNIYVLVPSSQRGNVRGLLGNFNGNPADDFALRNGTPLASPLSFQEMYRDPNSYANSWRITQAESLFDYGPGQNTATFTDVNAPYGWPSIHDLTPQQRLDAEAACLNAGVTQPFALEACILDVGTTGDTSFAHGAAQVEASLLLLTPNDVPPPASQPYYSVDFSNSSFNPEWSHAVLSMSPNGDAEFLGVFAQDSVTLALTHLPDHTKVTLTFELHVIGGWSGQAWGVNIDGVGQQLTTFSNTASPQSFPAWNTTANHPARSGAAAWNSLGYAAGDSTYKVKLTVDHSDPMLRLDFAGVNLLGGQTWGLDNVQVQLQ